MRDLVCSLSFGREIEMKKKIISLLLLLCLALPTLVACMGGGADLWADAIYTEDVALGTGACEFLVDIEVGEKSITLTVKTDKEYLGDALLELGIIEGTEGPYGLYIDKVNGILASFEGDGAWWGLTVNGETSMSGVSAVKVESGARYGLKYSK